nr:cell attachment protein sigma C [Avian orthoreovirus]UYB77602.1 cell attachment protein sigma C [Avian orthoreovirus]
MAGLTPSQRREVVGLILSLTSSGNTNCGDLTPIYDRLSSLESAVASLNSSINGLSQKVSDLEIDLQDVITSLGQTNSTLTGLSKELRQLSSSVDSVVTSVSDLSTTVSEHQDAITVIQTSVHVNTTDISNLKSSMSTASLNITDLEQRVKALESSSGSNLRFTSPLSLSQGVVSLVMDPYFCSDNQALTSYSTDAQLMQFQWLARGDDGSSSSIEMLVNAHCHGRRTDYMMSTTESFTVTGNSVSLVFSLDYITKPPTDMSRLIPRAGFQAASFPVDVSFTRDTTTHAYQVYGAFSNSRVFKITFLTGGTGTANLRFLTVRTGIDT